MTGVAWILLLIGVVFMIGSFFVTEKLSPSELNQIAELSEEELKRIIDRGLKNAETRIEDAIDEQVDQSSEKVDRSLEKVTNDKIMAISEYSDTVIESMNKTHNEIMFLYSMLNDKHTELTLSLIHIWQSILSRSQPMLLRQRARSSKNSFSACSRRYARPRVTIVNGASHRRPRLYRLLRGPQSRLQQPDMRSRVAARSLRLHVQMCIRDSYNANVV